MNDISSFAAATPFSIGLTGGIGSGKTTVANLFGERGAALIDTDAIAHQLTTPGGAAIDAIRAAFGDDFITTGPRLGDVPNNTTVIHVSPMIGSSSICHFVHSASMTVGRDDSQFGVKSW